MTKQDGSTNQHSATPYPVIALLLILGYFHPSLTHSTEDDTCEACIRLATGMINPVSCRRMAEQDDVLALELLIMRLADEHSDVRTAAARALGELGDPRAVDFLLDAFLSTRVYDALRNIAAPDTFDKLIERLPELRDPDFYSAGAALASLLIDFDTLNNERTLLVFIDYLHAGDIGGWGGQGTTIGTWLIKLADTRAVKALIDRLDTELDAEDEFHVYAIVRALWYGALQGTVDQRAVQPLLALLERDSSSHYILWAEVMEYAARTLSILADEPAVIPMSELIDRLEQRDDARMIEHHLPLLATANGYQSDLPALVHHATATAAYGLQLDLLGDLWGWVGERATVSAETLASDLARLGDPRQPCGVAPEAVERNPYLALFVARLHQQNGRYDMALEWVYRGVRQAPPEHVAVHILLGWLRAEALWKLGNPTAALVVVESLRTNWLPRALVLEQRRSGIALAAHTSLLEARLLEALGRHEAALDARQRAKADTLRAKRRDGIGIKPTVRSLTGEFG